MNFKIKGTAQQYNQKFSVRIAQKFMGEGLGNIFPWSFFSAKNSQKLLKIILKIIFTHKIKPIN
jgi:hypothetical protein